MDSLHADSGNSEEYTVDRAEPLEIPLVDGKPKPPRYIKCEQCGHMMRHRPGHVYGCPTCNYTLQLEIEDGDDGRHNPEEGQSTLRPVGETEQTGQAQEPGLQLDESGSTT